MSHTPGPWKIQEFSAQTYMISTFQNGLIAQHVPGEANARLIAAAPELYEALEELRDKVWRIIDLHRDSEARAAANMALERANAALAKARGDEGEENA